MNSYWYKLITEEINKRETTPPHRRISKNNYGKFEEIRKSLLERHSNNFHRLMGTEMSKKKFKQRKGYLHSLQVSPPKYLVITKEN